MHEIKIKRAYEESEKADGYRILVDRLWPRGIKKENLHHDLWAKEIAPTPEIRKEFNHEPDKFKQFRTEYLKELTDNEQADEFIKTVKEKLKDQNVTLLYAAKNTENNQAVVLKEWLDQQVNKK